MHKVSRFAALLFTMTTLSVAPSMAAEIIPENLPLGDGGAPTKVLLDNDKLRVNLISFPLNHVRPGKFVRRMDQVLVYLDDGDFVSLNDAGEPVKPSGPTKDGQPSECSKIDVKLDCGPIAPTGNHVDLHPRGSVSWRPKGNSAGALKITKAYRALYIELKHGTSTAPDPKAVNLPAEAQLGGGAPAKVVIDNEVIRATVISFPKDFTRKGGAKRRLDQLIVYLDDAQLVPASAGDAPLRAASSGPVACDKIKDCGPIGPEGARQPGITHPSGTIAWHPKDTALGTIKTGNAYRAVYLEFKK